MFKKIAKDFNYFEFIVFLLILLLFTASFAIFIDTKSNKKLETFIFTVHEKIIDKILSDIDFRIINMSKLADDYENIPYVVEYDAKTKFIVMDNGNIIGSNIGFGEDFVLTTINRLQNTGIFFSKLDDRNIFGIIKIDGTKKILIFQEMNFLNGNYSLYGEKVGIYDKDKGLIYSGEYIDLRRVINKVIFDENNGTTILKDKNNIFSLKKIHNNNFYLFIYSQKSDYLAALAKKGEKFTIVSFFFGLMFVIVLFFLKSFLSRYLFEKEKYEKLFKFEHEKFQKIVESITEGVCLIDNDYNLLWYNKFLEERIGSFKQDKCFKILHGVNETCKFCRLKLVRNEGKSESVRVDNFLKGTNGNYEIVWSPILNDYGQTIATVAVIKDITDSVRIQNEIIKSETYLKNIVYNSPEAIFTFDMDYEIKTINNEALKLIKSDLKPVNLRKIFDSKTIDEISRNESIKNFDCQLIVNELKPVPVQISVSKLMIENNVEYICVIKDMSKIKELEAQVIQSEKLSALGLLAGGVAHEINNPLVGILNMAQVLSKNLKDNASRKIVEVIIDAGMETKRIVENLLSYARQNINKDEMFEISESVGFALKILGSRIRNEKVNIHNKLQDIKVKGNKGKVHQIFLNLLSNAIDAVDKGGNIWINSLYENDKYIIEIKDDGKGIDKEVIDKIFDPFFTTKSQGKGTGLGLSITHGIIKEHGWDIEVESEKDKYTIFRIVINAER